MMVLEMGSLLGTEILLIEDATELTKLYRRVLEADGATVHEASTAKSGIVAASELYPHLIVCDLGLMGHGAFQFLAALKKAQPLARIPLLTLSQATEKADILRARALGVEECLLKPFQASQLTARAQ